jgi:hypothetical protein
MLKRNSTESGCLAPVVNGGVACANPAPSAPAEIERVSPVQTSQSVNETPAVRGKARSLPPIPMSGAIWWNEIRSRLLPLVVFIAALIAAVILWQRYVAPPPVNANPPNNINEHNQTPAP